VDEQLHGLVDVCGLEAMYGGRHLVALF
jgi:hypothetical protein